MYREMLQQDFDFRCGFEDSGAVDGNVLWLNGSEDTSEVHEESVLCQQWMTGPVFLGGLFWLLSNKFSFSTKVEMSTGVASVYPNYSDNIHLWPFNWNVMK